MIPHRTIARVVLPGLLATALIACDGGILGSANDSPVPVITAPEDGSTFQEGASVTFQGYAEDSEDGTLSGESLEWFSSVDGDLGTGEEVTAPDLSAGNHGIMLRATDSDGVQASTSILISIQALPSSVIGR